MLGIRQLWMSGVIAAVMGLALADSPAARGGDLYISGYSVTTSYAYTPGYGSSYVTVNSPVYRAPVYTTPVYAAPVYVAPVYQPVPVYVVPAPVYSPPVVHYSPPPVYYRPAPSVRYHSPRPVVVHQPRHRSHSTWGGISLGLNIRF